MEFFWLVFPLWRDEDCSVASVVFLDKRFDQHAHKCRDGQACGLRDFAQSRLGIRIQSDG
jgi:hypothetical protein